MVLKRQLFIIVIVMVAVVLLFSLGFCAETKSSTGHFTCYLYESELVS